VKDEPANTSSQNGDTKAQAEAVEKGELERQEVGVSGLGNGYGGYPAQEPGGPPIINLPGAPISTCHGESSPNLKTGSGPGVNATKVEFDQPGAGTLECGPFDLASVARRGPAAFRRA
jgi:hypothetical protein